MATSERTPQESSDLKGTQEKIAELQRLKAEAMLGGGKKRIEAQHKKGKLTARERLDLLLDPGTFNELDMFVTHRSTDFGLNDQRIPGAGGAVYSPAITDFIFMVEQTSYMFVTGPNVLKTVTHEDVTFEELGGALVHNSTSGVAHFSCPGEPECIRMIRTLMSYIPSNNLDDPPRITPVDSPTRAEEALDTIVPVNPNKPYDIKAVIRHIVDDGDFFEVQEYFAANLVVGFARMNGRSVG